MLKVTVPALKKLTYLYIHFDTHPFAGAVNTV